MFEPNFSIGVRLLAIILGFCATKSDRNLISVLICVLFAHVVLTTDNDDLNVGVLEHTSTPPVMDDGLGAAVPDAVATAESPITVTENENPVATDGFKSTLSSRGFDRQLSTP